MSGAGIHHIEEKGNSYSIIVSNKHREVEEYGRNVSGEFDKQVSDYEIKRYLPVL